VTEGSGRRGRRADERARRPHRAAWLPGWCGRVDAAGLLARAGWLAWADATAADGVLGG